HTASIIISRHQESEERQQAEQTLRESEYRYRQLASLLPVAVYTCDAAGLITYFNVSAPSTTPPTHARPNFPPATASRAPPAEFHPPATRCPGWPGASDRAGDDRAGCS